MCSTAGWHPRWAVGDTEAASVLRMEESRDRVATARDPGWVSLRLPPLSVVQSDARFFTQAVPSDSPSHLNISTSACFLGAAVPKLVVDKEREMDKEKEVNMWKNENGCSGDRKIWRSLASGLHGIMFISFLKSEACSGACVELLRSGSGCEGVRLPLFCTS